MRAVRLGVRPPEALLFFMYGSSNVTERISITQSTAALAARQRDLKALGLCALAVLGFSFTLPATRLAAATFHPLVLGPGRGAFAGLFAIALLVYARAPLPPRRHLRSLAVIAFGVVLAYPLLSSIAVRHVPAQHAVIVVGLMPLATSIIAVLRNGERPSLAFWAFALLGSAAVLAFGIATSQGGLSSADLLLVVAVVLCAVGYAEGGRLAAELDGALVMCWALVLALPVTLGCVAYSLAVHGAPTPDGVALLAFGQVSVVAMLFGFFAWYRGLALGGVARGSQVQLLQPVLSLVWCAALLGEPLAPETLWTGGAVLASALGSRWARS